jgi:hypothetical protein
MSRIYVDLTRDYWNGYYAVVNESDTEPESVFWIEANHFTTNSKSNSSKTWKKNYQDTYCPIKDENNKMILRYSSLYINSNIIALILDSRNIRTTEKLLILRERLERLIIVESDPEVYKIITQKLEHVTNVCAYNDLVQNFISEEMNLDYNLYYLDAMCTYVNIKDTINTILFRSSQKRFILALTTPLRNSGDCYEEVISFIKENNKEMFDRHFFQSQILHELRYNGQNMNNKGMYFVIYLVERKDDDKHKFIINII